MNKAKETAEIVFRIRNLLVDPLNELQRNFTASQVVAALLTMVAESVANSADPALARSAVIAALDAAIALELYNVSARRPDKCQH